MSACRVLRQFATAGRSVYALNAARNASRLSVLTRIPVAGAVRQFSGSARVMGQGTSDLALSQKLQSELKYETENTDGSIPAFLKEFKDQGVWQIEDKPGHDEVTLTRSFGNEQIRVMFSIADLQTEPDPEEEYEKDLQEKEEGDEEEQEEEVLQTFPIRTSMTITKHNGPGSISIDMMCQEGNFMIENVSFYPDSKVGTELTAEADWSRRGQYMGPPFDSLDIGLQEQFESFLEERGINETVALFIPEYAEYKEQHEYVSWLKNVQNFVDL